MGQFCQITHWYFLRVPEEKNIQKLDVMALQSFHRDCSWCANCVPRAQLRWVASELIEQVELGQD